MALVNCSFCGREVSDKAKKCPSCGQQLIEETADANSNHIVCEECGREMEAGVETCFYCGCPIAPQNEADIPQKVEIASVNLPITKKIKKKHIIIIVAAVVLIIAGIIVGSVIKSNYEAQQAAQLSADYYENLQTATGLMLVGAAEAEEAGNLIKSVWYNTIYKEHDSATDKYVYKYGVVNSDFNDSLAYLFEDSSFQNQLSNIKSNQESVSTLMKQLQNPPEEYEEAYEAIKELYDAYLELTGLAISPSGSLQTYSSNFNNADSEVLNCYKAMELYVG